MPAAPRAEAGQQGPMLRAGHEPREPPRGRPPTPRLRQARSAEATPGHRSHRPPDGPCPAATPGERCVAGQRLPESLQRIGTKAAHLGHPVHIGNSTPQRDRGRGLGREGRAHPQRLVEIAERCPQPGGVGEEPAVERLARQRGEPDRDAPHPAGTAWRPMLTRRPASSGCSSTAGRGRRRPEAPCGPAPRLRHCGCGRAAPRSAALRPW